MYQLVDSGKRMLDGDAINALANLTSLATTTSLTALAGGGRTGATALNNGMNRLGTVATAADSALLPPALAGSIVIVQNAGAAAATIYAQGSDTVAGVAGATGVSLASGATAIYACVTNAAFANVGGTAAGSFTTLTASGAVTLSPANAAVTLSPTGTGTVAISPATASAMDNVVIGGTTPLAGTFTAIVGTTLAPTSTVTLSPANKNVVISPSGSGVVTIAPATAGTINNVSLGATTPLAITGTTITGSTLVSTGYINKSVGNALTAVGTNRATSLALTKQVNNVTTAAAGTGVTLPVSATAAIGATVMLFNAGANTIQVYGDSSDTIDGVAGSTGVPLTNAKRCTYTLVAAATWVSAQLGVVSA